MLRVGITGGIGSGKSTACRALESLGIPVYESDSRAKAIMNEDPAVVGEIKELFGPESYADGKLNPRHIASRAFTDKTLLTRLNAAVHPAVMRDFDRWAGEKEAEGVPYVVLETAILFEAHLEDEVDYSVTVSAPLEERVERAALRDGADPAKVRDRVANQMADAERESRADFILDNAEHSMLLPQILSLHEKLLSLNDK